ncbi:hypothetical protein ACLOAU_14555 [Niabella sp. CJ426]|uniref:hypothetical protein n=1 Tax=Niabella sp. CJ426 TaxID=3393740 RepID=UPI003D031CC0
MSNTIKPQDLRLGNWVARYSYYRDTFIQYEQVKDLSIEDKVYSPLPSSYCSSIPLTEEILVRAGFDPFGRDGWFSLPVTNEWSFIRVYSKYPQFVELSVNRHSLMPPGIKFLHELQNLFYSLTGRELEIKL